MRVFKNKVFNKWAKGQGITIATLRDIANEMIAGNAGASLGKKVYKKRVALAGRGKRGGARAIIGFISDGNLFFLHGYAKNVQSDVTFDEKKALQELAAIYHCYTNAQLNGLVKDKKLFEIKQLKKKAG